MLGSNGVLVRSVVVHHPDLFCAASRADKRNLRGGKPGYTARQPANDFVRELMREFAYLRIGGCSAIDLGDHRLRRWIRYVVKPGLDGYITRGLRQIPEGDKVRVHR